MTLTPTRRRTTAALAPVIALAVVLGLLGAPSPTSAAPAAPAAAASAAADEVPITTGIVTWGIKASWRTYIGARNTTLEGGVTRNDDGTYDWPVTSGAYDTASRSLRLQLAGSARFTGYPVDGGGFILDSTFKDLAVVISPTEQSIRGTYVGNPRDGGDREELVDVVLATIDLDSAELETSPPDAAEPVTTWRDARTLGAADNGLYPAGTPFDPVTVRYDGPGAKPETGERLDAEGAPVLAPGARWLDDSSVEDGRVVFASRRHDVLHVVTRAQWGTAEAAYVVHALDAGTLQPLGQSRIPTPARSWLQVAFDPDTDALFLAAGDPDSAGTEIRRAVYQPGTHTYAAAAIARVPGLDAASSNNVAGLEWNTQTDELVVLIARHTAADPRLGGRLTFVTPDGADGPDGGWSAQTHDLRLPDAAPIEGTPARITGPLTASRTAPNDRFAVLRDGSYLVAMDGSYVRAGETQPRPIPALRLQHADDRIDLQYVAATAPPPVNANVAVNHSAAALAADGSAVLSGLNQIQYVDVQDGEVVVSEQLQHPDFAADGTAVAGDPAHGVDWVLHRVATQALTAWVDRKPVSTYRFEQVNRAGPGRFHPITTTPDGAVVLVVKDPESGRIGLQRFDLQGITPAVAAQPDDAAVELPAGERSRTVAFASTATGDDVARQWQVRAPGSSGFTDLPGETGETLSVEARPGMGGSAYRALYRNAAGTVASRAAELSVRFAPRVVAEPRSISVTEGAAATLVARVDGDPAPELTWQRRVGGFWQVVEADDEVAITTGEGLTSLTVHRTALDQSGTQFRVRAANDVGVVASAPARLTVAPAVTIPDDGLTLRGVDLRWSGSPEIQARPPFGSANYLSAGVSDGAEATYRAEQGAVRVEHVDAEGVRRPASYATRAAPTTGGLTQQATLGDGVAELDADGSALVRWSGAWTVNFYDGLVPFTLTDPVLEVDDDGSGELRADVSGYASSMQDPSTREPIDPVADVVVATFADVRVDPAGAVTVRPDYAGVAVDLPDDVAPQSRTGAWGAWPQPFVDVHLTTGLSSYWYSSGGAADPLKAPDPFVVDASAAEVVETPDRRATRTTVRLNSTRFGYGRAATATIRVAAGDRAVTGSVRVRTAGRTSSVRLNEDGVATYRLPAGLRPGTRTLQVRYDGTPEHAASGASARYAVVRVTPRLSLRAPSAVRAGSRPVVRLQAGVPGSPVTVGGRVTIWDGSRAVRQVWLRPGAQRVALPPLGPGTHRLRATLAPSAGFTAATSGTATLRVR